MIRTIALVLGSTAAAAAAVPAITGAGASFPAPLYTAWASAYRARTGQPLSYQAIGSGGGIKQIRAGTVDFGATDRPLKAAELAASGLYQFPTVIGGVVPIINLPGLRAGRLKLDGRILADIFLGKVTRWNDPEVQRANPQLRLPRVPITVVHRSDGSGTSFLLTSFLAMTSREWAARVGAGEAVAWPTGLGGKGNDGIAAFVKQTTGAIGYVEYAYARQNNATHALVCNRAGHCPIPAAASFGAAAAGASWAAAPGNDVLLLDQPDEGAWPITGATFLLIHRRQEYPQTAAAVLGFADWAFRSGDAVAAKLGYVPLPAPVKALIRRQWADVTAGGKPVYVPL
ncbi:phosphate ABC transporter substrate-binding protein PstS [Sphingomonas bacterium]|uniref:phosphate ABC transporter substrate-binding protein PstS n=1 Tax=Sphingomonas bacterium TaxID=1895847 RepID=UPI0015768369|nr:phosphate ABC transporter substrate-binding protein PstS [Sphingomonas bacterium]